MNLRHAIDNYRGHTIPHVRWVERRNLWFGISGVLILLSIAGLLIRGGLNFSIDFEGGSQITYRFEQPVTVDDVEATLAKHGITDAEVQVVNGDSIAVRTPAISRGVSQTESLRGDLADQAGISTVDVSIEDIGPTWGGEISRKALIGLVVVLAAITLYITVRFEVKMAIGAMIALVHDLTITVGVYALSGREVTPETVIAILTILGFSLYDTVVIYDKIKENLETQSLVARLGSDGVVDLSLNQVLMRSVNTSLVVLLPILSLLLVGGETLKDFALAMFIGVAIGAYSSIFIAAPILAILKKREQRFRQLEQRLTTRERAAARRPASPAAAAAAIPGAATGEAAAARATARTGTVARPRPKSKRRKPPAKRKRR